MKATLMTFFDSGGMLYLNFAAPNFTLNSAMYHMCFVISGTYWMETTPSSWYLATVYHDNGRLPVYTGIAQFLEEKFVTIFPHPLYSPTLHPLISGYFHSWKGKCEGAVSTRIGRLNQLFMPHCSAFSQMISRRRSSWNGAREWRNVLPLVAVTSKRAYKAAHSRIKS